MQSPGSRNCVRPTDLAQIPVGRRVVVIGGGMTAIDAGVQARGLGAEEVTICYRGPQDRMKASPYEQELAQTRGVAIRFHMQPRGLIVSDGRVAGMEFDRDGEMVRHRVRPSVQGYRPDARHVAVQSARRMRSS